MSLESRVIELESRQAFQDDTIQALNDVLVEQGRVIERLQLQMAELIKRYEEVVGQYGGEGAGAAASLLRRVTLARRDPLRQGLSVSGGKPRPRLQPADLCRGASPKTQRAGLRPERGGPRHGSRGNARKCRRPNRGR